MLALRDLASTIAEDLEAVTAEEEDETFLTEDDWTAELCMDDC